MNLLRRLKAAWSFHKSEPYQPVEKDFWKVGDGEALSMFLTTETGRKLRVLLSNRIGQTAVQATLKNSTPYDSGYAGGCRGTAAFIDSLLRISPPTSESLENDIDNQDAHAVDRYRP